MVLFFLVFDAVHPSQPSGFESTRSARGGKRPINQMTDLSMDIFIPVASQSQPWPASGSGPECYIDDGLP